MSERKGPEPDDTAERFLRHLTGAADEAESRELERAVLEDDELFLRLANLESELVDAYVDGQLDEQTTRRLAPLVGASPRLRAKAETTLALATQRGERPMPPLPSESAEGADASRPYGRFVLLGGIGVTLALVVWLLVQAAVLRASLTELRVENAELRERSAELTETVSRLEASNRTLTRRLARLEARSGR